MKKYRISPVVVPPWIYKAVQVLRPRERLTVSEWAEKFRILPDGNSIPGPWRNSVTPYLVEIMDTFSDDEVETIIYVKPTQVGGTSAMENMLGSLIDQDPGPTMIVYPSDDLAERTVEAKLEPMIKKCQPLSEKYRENESKKLALKFRDMTVYLTGANSPADLASTNIRYLFLDEVDKYPGASKKEADPVSLAMERTKTYTVNKKIFMASTPTLKTGHIWKAKETADVEKHYFVPCPHCGEYIELKFAQIKWPGKEDAPEATDRAEMAVYVCQACGCVITDQDKGKMLQAGHWQAVRKSAHPKSVAFWMNTLYSPFTRFSDIAREFMRSKDDPELFHNFVNSWLAEPWEDTKLKTSAELVLERQTELEAFVLPEWTKLLTGGVDVQENCLYWTIRAWGDFITSQNIAHGQAFNFTDILRVMNLEYKKLNNEGMVVQLVLIDSGDQTDEVYDFCALNTEWALPCKGIDGGLSHYRLSKVNKTESKAYGMNLVLVDGGKYKDMIASRMRKPNDQKGSWMVHKDCDREYAEQVTAEHKITERTNGRENNVWRLKTSHAANHYLDAEVYCMAAADVLGVRTLFLQTETSEAETSSPAPQAPLPEQYTPEESWIKQNEKWV